jgi:glyoxylase-like metal-dependent hydrolase (beta-lactamase superfamily II)
MALDIKVFRLPLQGLALDSINVYFVSGVLIDAGLYSMRTLHALAKSLRASGLKICSIEKVVVTHYHVDHISLLPLLYDMCSVDSYIGWGELNAVRDMNSIVGFFEKVFEFFKLNGAPVEEVKSIIDSHPAVRFKELYDAISSEIPIKPLREGDTLLSGALKVVEVPGHSPGSIILVNESEKIAFVGDTLLNDITPHVTAHLDYEDPLGDYIESLKKIESMKLRIAYPGHRSIIEDPTARALELIKFHEARSKEILALIKEKPRTGYEVAKNVKWRVRYESWDQFPPIEKYFAIGETIAHLLHLKKMKLADYYEEKGIKYWYAINP